MTDPSAEARIRDLKRRITQDATSPLFIGLAEEYRASGQLSEAIRTLEKGIQTYPHYVSAKVALARAYLEAGQTGDAALLFSRILALDPGNLISARALADIHLTRGDRLEAVKKYKLYRALSGDRSVNEIISRIEDELPPASAPPPAPAPKTGGRALADLYFEQGHYTEALAIYEELALAEPEDAEIAGRLREAASRLPSKSPIAQTPSGGGQAARRQAKIQALKGWLRVIQIR